MLKNPSARIASGFGLAESQKENKTEPDGTEKK